MVLFLLLSAVAFCADPPLSTNDPLYVPPRKRPYSTLQIGVTKRSDNCTNKVQRGDEVEIAYNLTLFTAKRRVDYTKPNESFIFKTGYSQTLDGLDQGVLGMCIGERRRILIPASLAYGMRGADDVVPGGCAIIMDVELLDMFPLEFDEEKADKFLKRRMELEERAKEGDWDEYLEPKPFDPLRYNLIRQVGGVMKRTYHAPPRPTLPRRVREKPRKKRPQLEDLEI